MNEKEQILHMESEIERTVTRFRKEYDITYASAIGVLRLQMAKLELEALDNEEDDN